jgi:PKHD-type hydroxylase
MMFKVIELLADKEVAELKRIAAATDFVDGRASNPTSTVKNNLQLHEPKAYQQSAAIVLEAMRRHEDFNNFVMPVAVAPPMMTRYTPGMRYGAHHDMAYIHLGNATIRSDISCTVFLNPPEDYDGGALRIHLGSEDVRFRLPAGHAIFYPSNTYHEVEEVTRGERLVAISFIQSRVADPFQREMLYEINEVAALEGYNMSREGLARLQFAHQNLLRYFGDRP